jgi:hypothetical protein
MKLKPSIHIAIQLILLVFFVVGQASSDNCNWCPGQDDHFTVEKTAGDACCTVPIAPEGQCSLCPGISIGIDMNTSSLRNSPSFPKQIAFLLEIADETLQSPQWFAGHLSFQPPPWIDQPLVALRTVVLIH